MELCTCYVPFIDGSLDAFYLVFSVGSCLKHLVTASAYLPGNEIQQLFGTGVGTNCFKINGTEPHEILWYPKGLRFF
jgi:hypothetical protein